MDSYIFDTLVVAPILTTLNILAFLLQHLIYFLSLPFTPILKLGAGWIFRWLGMELNGKDPSDPRVSNWKTYAKVFAFGSVGLVEVWADRWAVIEDVYGFGEKIIQHQTFMKLFCLWDAGLFHYLRWNFFNIQTPRRAKRFCRSSYGMDLEFFRGLTGESLTYSVACYDHKDMTLEAAQLRKMEILGEKMDLKPGYKVLDAGCGYGKMSAHLCQNYGVSVVANTNCHEMAVGARDVCDGLDVTVREADWREVLNLPEMFDRIVTVEMLFHLGRANLREFFRKAAISLKPGGLLVIQDFTVKPGYPGNVPASCKYYYPGAYMPSTSEILGLAERKFKVLEFTDRSLDMAYTGRDLDRNIENMLKGRGHGPLPGNFNDKEARVLQLIFIAGQVAGPSGIVRAYHLVLKKNSYEKL